MLAAPSLPGKLGGPVGRIAGAVHVPALADVLDRIPAELPGEADIGLERAMVEPFAWIFGASATTALR